MKYIIYSVVIIFLIGIIAGGFHHFTILRAVPQLVLLLVIVVAAERKNLDYLFVAIVGGVFMDFATSVAFGSFTLSFIVIGFVAKFLFDEMLLARSPLKHVPWIVSAAIASQYLWIWLYNGTLIRFESAYLPLRLSDTMIMAIGAIIYTLILLFPAYWIMDKLNEYIERLEQRKKY